MFACIMALATRDAPQSYATSQTLLDALTPYNQDDVRGQWSDDHMLMVQALTWNTPESRHESTPEVCKDTGRVIISWVRLDNREALCAQLGLADVKTLTDPQIILESHRKWGADCADQLEGDFSFVIYDPARAQAFCARDSIGAKPFFYYADEKVFIAASTAAIFRGLKRLSITPSQEWIARYMSNAPHQLTTSAFEQVCRLAPAHSLQTARAGKIEPKEYFKFTDLAPIADYRDPKYVDDYRAAFQKATNTRLRCDFLVGAESSGGLDSSSIVGHAVNHLPHDIKDFHCFGMIYMERDPEFILQTALHSGVRHNHISSNIDAYGEHDEYVRTTRVLGYPASHSMVMSHREVLRQCQLLGIRTLLSGYGGDEMVTHQAHGMYNELIRNRQFKSLVGEMHGSLAKILVRHLIDSYRSLGKTSQAKPSHLPKLVALNWGTSLLQQGLIDKAKLKDVFTEHYQNKANALTLNDFILGSSNFSPHRVERLEACVLVANSYGVEYRWPLYDRELMIQFLKTPAIEKRHKGMGRFLHRRAVSGTIPDTITWKKNKSMGRPASRKSGRKIPDLLAADRAAPMLGSVIDFAKLRQADADFRAANSFRLPQILQRNALWRMTIVAQWLKGW